MASQVLITMDDLETAVRLNAALEAAGSATAMFSSLDDARGSSGARTPTLVVLTGAVHDPPPFSSPLWPATPRSPRSRCSSPPTRSGGSGSAAWASPS